MAETGLRGEAEVSPLFSFVAQLIAEHLRNGALEIGRAATSDGQLVVHLSVALDHGKPTSSVGSVTFNHRLTHPGRGKEAS